VAGINPTSGPHGTTVKITGTNFSPVASENTVLFNGTTATVISASYTGLDVTVPKGAGTGMVSVIVNGITANGPSFTYNLSATVTTVAQFNAPIYTASDANGNIYISDYNGNVIRRLTPAGALTIIAGSGQPGYFDDKNPLLAQFDHPAGIAVDANGNIYVADNGNNCIRRISSTNVSTIAGSTVPGYVDAQGGQAQFNTPIGLGIDGSGNLYVGDTGNHRIRRVTSVGVVTTVAGNGQAGFADGNGPLAQFNGIAGVAVDGNNNIYVADGFNHRIRKINGQGVVSTLAGNGTAAFANGTGTAARFNVPYGVACDASGNVYVADFSNHSIRKVTSAGVTTTTAGNGTSGFVDAIGSAARFNQPTAVTVAPNGNIYVADFGNQRIRLISFE
ncbi:MAG: IPT/TIG domain-containing protein, partial [Bacteroidota bacterium]